MLSCWMPFLPILLIAGCAIIPNTATHSACIPDKPSMLALDYWTFDQDLERGMQSIAQKKGCELAAADLIQEYHLRLRNAGEPIFAETPQGKFQMSKTGEMSVLYWHEAQIRALNGKPKPAAELMQKSMKPEPDNHRGWNSYVQATIAFLKNDRAGFEDHHIRMQKNAPGVLNLRVLDGMAACWGKTYKEAYGSPECNRRHTNKPTNPTSNEN